MQRTLPLILVGYGGVFALYVAVRLGADAVRAVARRRRFARYLRELQAEADALLVENTLRRIVGGGL